VSRKKDSFSPLYNQAVTAEAVAAGTTHTARKHIIDIERAVEQLINHRKIKEDRELRDLAGRIHQQFYELTAMYNRLHEVFRNSSPTFELCGLEGLINEVRDYMAPRLREYRINFISSLNGSELPKLRVDPILIKVVFINLINNSIEAEAKAISVRAKRTIAEDLLGREKDSVEITFQDNGIGVPEEWWEKVFELYFTTNKRTGTGLGLAVSRDILNKHAGEIRIISSREMHGTTIVVTLPIEPPQDI
jgi:signal transduction histidine kinase